MLTTKIIPTGSFKTPFVTIGQNLNKEASNEIKLLRNKLIKLAEEKKVAIKIERGDEYMEMGSNREFAEAAKYLDITIYNKEGSKSALILPKSNKEIKMSLIDNLKKLIEELKEEQIIKQKIKNEQSFSYKLKNFLGLK